MATRIHFDIDMADNILDDAAMAILTTKVRQMVANTANDALDQQIKDCCESTAKQLAGGFGSRYWGSSQLKAAMESAMMARVVELGINEDELVNRVVEKIKSEFQTMIDESVRRSLASIISGGVQA